MKLWAGAIAWFVTGAAAGFGGLALAVASLGAIALLPALAVAAILIIFRFPSASMFLVGAGSAVSLTWLLHITSGDTPDNQVWPVLAGAALAAIGLLMFFRLSPRDAAKL